jgi:hypothetical protein
MSSTVTDYSAAAAALPNEYFLGQIISFTITEADIDLDQMRDELTTRNLKTTTLKKRLRPIDAFKKACNDVATKFSRDGQEQHSLLVRPVGQDAAESHRHVIFERAVFKAGSKRRVEHETIWKLRYNRGERLRDGTVLNDFLEVEEQFSTVDLSAEETAWIAAMIGGGDALKARFAHYSTHLDSHGVRSFVREYLKMLGAVNVKFQGGGGGGGLYFVAQQHVDELRDLAEFVRSIGSMMRLIPLLDIVDQRDMLAEAFIADTMDEIATLDVEISKILAVESRTITDATYDEFVAKAVRLMDKRDEYNKLLDRSLDTADMQLKIFKNRVLTLAARVRQPKSLGGGK